MICRVGDLLGSGRYQVPILKTNHSGLSPGAAILCAFEDGTLKSLGKAFIGFIAKN